jgi:pyruvate/2-oxoglutarate/acetoin dehydrogenase E1 component
LIDSVRKTGAMVIVDQASKSFGTTGEFAITIAEVLNPAFSLRYGMHRVMAMHPSQS